MSVAVDRRARPPLGPDGRVRQRRRRCSPPRARRAPPAIGAPRRMRRSPSKAWPRRSASGARACRSVTFVGGARRRRRRLLHAVVRGGGRLPDQRRRPAAAQLADVRAGDVRADDPRRRARRRARAARRQRPAAACTTRSSTRPTSTWRSRNRFFLCLRSDDPGVRRATAAARLLDGLRPLRRSEVPAMRPPREPARRRAARRSRLASLAGCERVMRDMYEQPKQAAGDAEPAVRRRPGVAAAAAGQRRAREGRPRRDVERPARRRCGARRRSSRATPTACRRGRAATCSLRGQERYDIYCLPCHSAVGDGDGPVVRRGFPAPPSYHQPRLRAAPDRHFYDVISHGYGVMFPYADRVAPATAGRSSPTSARCS